MDGRWKLRWQLKGEGRISVSSELSVLQHISKAVKLMSNLEPNNKQSVHLHASTYTESNRKGLGFVFIDQLSSDETHFEMFLICPKLKKTINNNFKTLCFEHFVFDCLFVLHLLARLGTDCCEGYFSTKVLA